MWCKDHGIAEDAQRFTAEDVVSVVQGRIMEVNLMAKVTEKTKTSHNKDPKFKKRFMGRRFQKLPRRTSKGFPVKKDKLPL